MRVEKECIKMEIVIDTTDIKCVGTYVEINNM